jgi:two-component system, cell cycle response regulator
MKVLVADDEPIARLLVCRHLTIWGHEVVSTCNGEEAWGVLSQPDAPRVAVLDWVMPGLDGPEICRRVRQQGLEPYIYLLLVTGKDRPEDLITGLLAGADDYVTKPYNAQELKVRLRTAARIVKLQTELVTAREALRFEASHDALTGAYNRAAIHAVLQHEAASALAQGTSLGVAMVDLDHFKRINDAHGHQAGDEVLREVVRRIAGALRPQDAVGRYGGEELLVVLPRCEELDASIVGERLRRAVSATPVLWEKHEIHVTASVGIAATSGRLDTARVIGDADAALYDAKRGGRNRVACAARSRRPGAMVASASAPLLRQA